MTLEIASRDAVGLMALSVDPPAGTSVWVDSVFNPPGAAAAGMTVAHIEILPGKNRNLLIRAIARALIDCLRPEAGPIRIAQWEVPLQDDVVRATLRLALACQRSPLGCGSQTAAASKARHRGSGLDPQ